MISFLLPILGLLFVYMTLWYFVALAFKRNDVADIAWGIGFVVAAAFSLYQTHATAWRSSLIFGLVCVWAFRLSGYIFLRNRGRDEDFRYRNWRKEWGSTVVWRSYLQVFLLQGLFVFLVGLPIWEGIAQDYSVPFSFLDALGVITWLVGFFFEAVGDYQMAVFRKRRSQEKRIMKSGLWKYTRHPNYFGEALMTWGLFLLSMACFAPVWVIVGPILLTTLLMRVSGVPMLEKKYKNNPEYRAYQASTPAFFPRFRFK